MHFGPWQTPGSETNRSSRDTDFSAGSWDARHPNTGSIARCAAPTVGATACGSTGAVMRGRGGGHSAGTIRILPATQACKIERRGLASL